MCSTNLGVFEWPIFLLIFDGKGLRSKNIFRQMSTGGTKVDNILLIGGDKGWQAPQGLVR